MKHTITIQSLDDLGRAAKEFLSLKGENNLFAFHGSMGTGKTTFISALCKELGVRDDAVSSPTFSIINEYRTSSGESIFHFDFYRIENLSEAMDIGLDDYLDSGCLCLMEWPENIEELLPEETVLVQMREDPDGKRVLEWEG